MRDVLRSYQKGGVETSYGKPHKQQAVEAFRSFGEEGTAFLAESEYRDSFRNLPKNNWILETLSNLPWNNHRDLVSETHYRSQLARDILEETGLSFEHAQRIIQPRLEASDPLKQASVIGIFQCVTNQFDSLAITVAPYINHPNGWIAQMASNTMLKVGRTNAEPHFRLMTTGKHSRRFAAYYQMLATYAPYSTDIKNHLQTLSKASDKWVSGYALLALAHAFPEDPTPVKELTLRIENGFKAKEPHLISPLSTWPLATPSLHGFLIHHAQESEKTNLCIEIINLLYKHQVDLTPLIPKLQSFLYYAPHHNGYFYSVGAQDTIAATYLLEMNKEDPKVWFYFVDLFGNILPPFEKQGDNNSKSIVSLSKPRASFLQFLAPYHENAARIVKKYPLAQVEESERMNHWQKGQLIQHKLIPPNKPTPVN